ncbi:MAG: MFS family permease [Cryomorphaceae bacterium]
MLGLPKNIIVISIAMALSFTITSMMVLVAGILGAQIAPSPELATLPMALMVVGTATATIPAALLMQKIGRKAGMAIGIAIALVGAGLACYAAVIANFTLLIVGSTMLGLNAAFTQQGRFIILENANNQKQAADGLTLGLMANLVAAFLGPELGLRGEHLLGADTAFAGSFLLGSITLMLSLVALSFYKNVPTVITKQTTQRRSIFTIMRQPTFILAAGSAAVGYAVMALVMTATPISMHEVEGHSLGHTKLVIQTHIIAMFLPSLISGALLKRGYRKRLLLLGLAIYALVMFVGYSGSQVMHFWWALLLLGLGWNLIFMTSTSLLPSAYSEDEKFQVQAANDFLIFGFQAVAAFFAGWLLYTLSWSGVLSIALAITIAWGFVVAILSFRNSSL